MNEQVTKWIAEKKEASKETIQVKKKYFLQANNILCGEKIYAPETQTKTDLEYPFSETEMVKFKNSDGYMSEKIVTRCYKYETPDITDEEFEELKKCLALVKNEEKKENEKKKSGGGAFKFLSVLELFAIPIGALVLLDSAPQFAGATIFGSIISFIYILSHLNAHSSE